MENIYRLTLSLFKGETSTVALKKNCGRNYKRSILLVLSMLLYCMPSFGQGSNVVYQFTSSQSGKWEVPATWGKTATGTPVAGTHYPGSTDDVKISSSHIVTIESGVYSCKNLTIVGGGGNPKEGGQLIIGNFDDQTVTAVARLNLANLKFSTANGKPKERATLRMGYTGYLTVSESIYKINITGNGKDESIVTGTTNTDIFYSFRRASTIEYRGGAQSIFNFNAVSVTEGGITETSTTYGNLMLSGSGVKTPAAGLEVRSDLSVNSGVTFDALALNHTILKSMFNAGTIEARTSTINIGENFANTINSVTGTFNSGTGIVNYNGTSTSLSQEVAGVQYNNLTFSGASPKAAQANLSTKSNLLIDTGSNFNAGNFTHTISGNWTNAGTFNAGTSKVVMNGGPNADGSYKTISSTSTGTSLSAFNNLTISSGSKTLLSNVNVTGILDLDNVTTTENKIFTGNFRVDFRTTGSLARTETEKQYIVGKVAVDRTLSGTSVAETFGQIGIAFTTSSSVDNVPITIVRTTGTVEDVNGQSSASRYYDINAGALAEVPNLSVSLSFLKHEIAGTIETYNVFRRDFKGDWFQEQSTRSGGVAASSFTYSLNNVTQLGRYTIAAPPTPLPVELISFKAQRQAQGVLLTWETASEKENKGFEVQASADGKSFSRIAFVESKVVNSTVKQRYSYTDKAAIAVGTRYYRLAQIDLDGTTTYSNLKAVDMDTKVVAAAAFPNPFSEGQEVTVRLPQGGESRQLSIVLTNTLGQVIAEQQAKVEAGQVELTVSTAKANAKGIYLLTITDNGTKYTFKLLKK